MKKYIIIHFAPFVEMSIPLKEGLRLSYDKLHYLCCRRVEMSIPLKEGLRHQECF